MRWLLSNLGLVTLVATGCGAGSRPEPPAPAVTRPAGASTAAPGLVRGGTCYALEGEACTALSAFEPEPKLVAAIERCYRARQDGAARGGRVTVIERAGERELVGLAGETWLRACIEAALAEQPALGERACSLALVPGGPIDAPPWAARLEVTRSRVALDGRHVIHTHLLEPPELPVATVRQLDSAALLAAQSRAGGLTDLVLRAHPAVDGGVVARAVGPFVRTARPRLLLARAVGLSEVWAVVDPLGSSNDLPCTAGRLAVEIVPRADGLDLRTGERTVTLPGPPAQWLPALAEALAAARQRDPRRVDLGLTIGAGVTYGDLLRALEIAVAAGYWDVHLRGTDPAGGGF